MFCRFFIIAIMMLNLIFCQTFFNKIVGGQLGHISARSQSMGQTHFMTANNSALILRNPARLSQFKPGFYFDCSFMGDIALERRSIDLKDYFGDFLTEGDYVSNSNSNLYNNFGAIINSRLFFLNFSAGLSHGPLSSLDYSYEEEVRGSESFEGGIIGIRDPIEGYHVLEHSGDINLSSLGFALGLNEFFSAGISLNYIHDDSYSYRLDVIKIADSVQNLAIETSQNGKVNFNGDLFPSISIGLKTGKTDFSLGYESSANIRSDNASEVTFDSAIGLPIYLNSDLEYVDSFINIEKPEKYKLGFNYKNGYKQYTLLSIEMIQKKYSTKNFEDSKNFNLGLEYVSYKNIVRMGLSYEQPTFKVLAPVTSFTLGTSTALDNITFDFGFKYSYQKYKYGDLFPVSGDVRPDYDNIHNSNWSIISTILYKL